MAQCNLALLVRSQEESKHRYAFSFFFLLLLACLLSFLPSFFLVCLPCLQPFLLQLPGPAIPPPSPVCRLQHRLEARETRERRVSSQVGEDGLHPTSDGVHPSSDSLQPNSESKLTSGRRALERKVKKPTITQSLPPHQSRLHQFRLGGLEWLQQNNRSGIRQPMQLVTF